jgi:DNA helicase-2/ATP-dependent DNA helicase PcrA
MLGSPAPKTLLQDEDGVRAVTLTSEQQAFVNHTPLQHARVLAGPGTGKSYASVAFLERLAREHPDMRARMLTFTRAATAEFAQKMGDAELEGLGVAPPATVHSFALSVLMRAQGANIPMPLRIADFWEVKTLIRPHLALRLRASGHYKATPTLVKDLEDEMAAGWESLDPNRVLKAVLWPELRAAYVGLWKEHRWAFGYVLLAELPYRAGSVMEDVGADIDLDVLLVDEYQDLNEADIKLIRLVAQSGVSVLAIGDDDQSIYGFRWAAPEGIRRFLSELDTTFDYPLTKSRRCGRAILYAANLLIQSEPGRAAKPPLTPLPETPQGQFAHLRFIDDATEVHGVARIVAARIVQGVAPSRIAILVRSRPEIWAAVMRPALEKQGITLASTDWIHDVLQQDEMRRGLALAHLALNKTDSLAWWTLLHFLQGVGPKFIDYIYDSREQLEGFGSALLRLAGEGFPGTRAAVAARVTQEVTTTLKLISELEVEGAELDDRGWGGWLFDQLDQTQLIPETAELLTMVGRVVPPGEGLTSFLAHLEPTGKDLAASSSDSVRLMTMTQSKGLTVDTAIVMGVEDGIIPMPYPKGEINEERRLLYVAMTRATDMCLLTWAARRRGQIAHQGTPKVNQLRYRCPLLEGLPIEQWADGMKFVKVLERAAGPS